MFITPFMLVIAAIVLLVVVLAFAACIVSLRRTVADQGKRLTNKVNHQGKDLDAFQRAINHFEHRLNNLHNQLVDLCAPVARTAKGEAAFIPDMTTRNHNDWSVLLSDLVQQADNCGFALTVDFSVPVEQ